MQCACAILSPVTCPDLQHFSTLSHKRHDFRGGKKLLNVKCVLNLPKTFVWNISHSKKNWARNNQNCTFMITSHSVFLRMRNVSDKRCRWNQNTHFMFNYSFQKQYCLWDNVEKYCRTWQATDDSMMHVFCIQDNWDYKHTLRICITYCLSTATMVAQKCINVILFIHCPSC